MAGDRPAGEQPAYDPTGIEPMAAPATDGRSLPPLREVAEIRKPSTIGGVVYLCVLGAALAGIGIAATGAWRTGVSWLAVSLLAASVTRLALADDNAGMLRVRRKLLDALILSAAGVVLLVLAGTIPDQPR